MLNDLRFALRQLVHRPAFAAIVILTLALGIGPNTAMFSLIYGVLLRPLPYAEPERLVRPTWEWQQPGQGINALTATQYVFWKEHNRVFDGISAYGRPGAGFNVLAGGEPIYARGMYVAHDLFSLLGVAPHVGRGFSAEDDTPGGPSVAVVSHAFWQQRLGGDTDVTSRAVAINGNPHAIVGVMPPEFAIDGDPVDLWMPLRLQPNPNDQGHNTLTIARLRPGVTVEQAQADMGRLLIEIQDAYPGHVSEGERGVFLERYHRNLVGDLRDSLWLLMGAVGLVLLIATANAAALFLGRAASREQEFAVRAALGARAGIAVRPLVVESVLLSVVGAAVGVLLADWSLNALLALGAQDVPLAHAVRLHGQVLAATLTVSVVIGLIAGLPPTIRVMRRDVQSALKPGERALGPVRQRARAVLVGGQLALSTALLAGSLLLIVTLQNLFDTDAGFDPTNVWAVQMSLPPEEYATQEEANRFTEDVRLRLAGLPGVSAVATTSSLPLERGYNLWIRASGDTERESQIVDYRAVSADYFAVLGIPLLRGRAIAAEDGRGATPVVVVNRSLADRFWPSRSPVGESVSLGSQSLQIVGVAADVREFGLDASYRPMIYVPAVQVSDGLGASMRRAFLTSWVIKSRVPPGSRVIQQAVNEVDPTQPVVSVRAMEQVVASSMGSRRFIGKLLNVFAALALTLAAVGVYGIVSYEVNRRRRELGVRAALGARRDELIGMVLRQGVRLAAAGAAIGLVIALYATRWLEGFLFGVSPRNPLVLAAACIVLAGVALLACYVPARRAARVDPMEALRYE